MRHSAVNPSLKHKIKSAVKSIDSYAVPITLSYKSKDKFRTLPGGVVTIISRLIILLFFVFQIPEVINKNKTVSYKTVRVNLNNDNDPFIFNSDNFDIAVRVYNPYGVLSNEMTYNRSKYFKFEFSSLSNYPALQGNQTIVVTNNTAFEFGTCTNDRLGNLTDQTSTLKLTDPAWVCPKTINYQLLGSTFTQSRTTLKFRVVPCNQAKQAGIADDNVTCASDAEIEKAINGHFIQIVTLVEYFDENEFEASPIKKEIKNIMQNIGTNLAFFKSNIYQRVNITTIDSWFGSSFNNKRYSYLENVDFANALTGSIKPGRHDMITFIYSKYSREQVIVRRVTSLMDILSTAGGFSSVIMFISILISKSFQQQLFEKSLIKKIFKEQQPNRMSDLHSSDNNLDLATQILSDIKSRQPPKILYKQYFNQMVQSIMLCRKRSSIHLISSKLDFYTQALHSNIDIVALVKNIAQIKLLQQMILNTKQRKLLPYLDLNILKPNEYSYYKKSSSFNPALQDTELLQCIEHIISTSSKNKKSRIFLSNLANKAIDNDKQSIPQKVHNQATFGFVGLGQESSSPSTLKSEKSKRNLLKSQGQLKGNINLNETSKQLMTKNNHEQLNT